MIIVIDKTAYYEIFSNAGKKIIENNSILWDTSLENPIAVNIERYRNGDYVETDIDIEQEETEEQGE